MRLEDFLSLKSSISFLQHVHLRSKQRGLATQRFPSELNGRHADGCHRACMPVNPEAFSSPYTCKRQLPAVGLLPSGPEPVPAIMVHRPSLRKIHGPVLSLQDGES